MNRIGATVPNTNLHAVEGSNPIWSMEERLPQDDNIRFFIRFVYLNFVDFAEYTTEGFSVLSWARNIFNRTIHLCIYISI
jgi:hypothetical protein